jgi:hypothetical protein
MMEHTGPLRSRRRSDGAHGHRSGADVAESWQEWHGRGCLIAAFLRVTRNTICRSKAKSLRLPQLTAGPLPEATPTHGRLRNRSVGGTASLRCWHCIRSVARTPSHLLRFNQKVARWSGMACRHARSLWGLSTSCRLNGPRTEHPTMHPAAARRRHPHACLCLHQ